MDIQQQLIVHIQKTILNNEETTYKPFMILACQTKNSVLLEALLKMDQFNPEIIHRHYSDLLFTCLNLILENAKSNDAFVNVEVTASLIHKIKLLIKNGANVNTKKDNGQTILYSATDVAIRCDLPELITPLLDSGANPLIFTKFYTVNDINNKAIKTLIAEAIHNKLMRSIELNDTELFETCIAQLSNSYIESKLDDLFNTFSSQSEYNQQSAAPFKHLILKRLIKSFLESIRLNAESRTLDVLKIINNHITPYDIETFDTELKGLLNRPLNAAIRKAQSTIVQAFLESQLLTHSINEEINGVSRPLAVACEIPNNRHIFDLLLNDASVDPNIRGTFNTPLLIQCIKIKSLHTNAMCLLAHPKIDVLAETDDGRNAFEVSFGGFFWKAFDLSIYLIFKLIS